MVGGSCLTCIPTSFCSSGVRGAAKSHAGCTIRVRSLYVIIFLWESSDHFLSLSFTASTVNGFARSIIVPMTGGNKAQTPREDSTGRPNSMQKSRTESLRSFCSSVDEGLAPNLQRASDFSVSSLPPERVQCAFISQLLMLPNHQLDRSTLILPEIYAEALKQSQLEVRL